MQSIEKYKINEIAGFLVLVLYYYVFTKEENQSSYLNSKFWLGVNPNIVKLLIPFQILAGIGGVYWYQHIRKNKQTTGLLSYEIFNNKMSDVLVLVFLIGSILWPISLLQKDLLEKKTMTKSLICCSGLFMAAIAGIMLQAGSFESNNISGLALLGITLFNTTVVLNDGIGWCARLLYQTLN